MQTTIRLTKDVEEKYEAIIEAERARGYEPNRSAILRAIIRIGLEHFNARATTQS